jgi:hypothetical protein
MWDWSWAQGVNVGKSVQQTTLWARGGKPLDCLHWCREGTITAQHPHLRKFSETGNSGNFFISAKGVWEKHITNMAFPKDQDQGESRYQYLPLQHGACTATAVRPKRKKRQPWWKAFSETINVCRQCYLTAENPKDSLHKKNTQNSFINSVELHNQQDNNQLFLYSSNKELEKEIEKIIPVQ